MATKKETAQEKRERIEAQETQMNQLKHRISTIFAAGINRHVVENGGGKSSGYVQGRA